MEKLFLKRFKINGLFGMYDINIPFESNINIFVGENGLGKTTILNALNYVIQADSDGLSTINFEISPFVIFSTIILFSSSVRRLL